jgi:hypothetical protein
MKLNPEKPQGRRATAAKQTNRIATKMHKKHKEKQSNLVPFVPLCGY